MALKSMARPPTSMRGLRRKAATAVENHGVGVAVRGVERVAIPGVAATVRTEIDQLQCGLVTFQKVLPRRRYLRTSSRPAPSSMQTLPKGALESLSIHPQRKPRKPSQCSTDLRSTDPHYTWTRGLRRNERPCSCALYSELSGRLEPVICRDHTAF